MKKNISLLILSVLLSSIVSCELVKGPSVTTKSLAGTWNWQRTTGGFIGVDIDADSVDYVQKLVINDEAEAFHYRDNEVITTYDIRFEKPEWAEQKTWIFYPKKSTVPSYITTLKDGKLVLRNACTDCYTLYFQKSI